jgi:hypothetical protein
MKMSLRGLCWIVVGGMAAISCGGSGTSGPGTGGSGGAGPGVGGDNAGGRGGSSGSPGTAGSTGSAGSTGAAGITGSAGSGGSGVGGSTGGGGAGGGGGGGGSASGGTGGASAGGAGGRGGSSGGAGGGAAGAAGGAAGAAGRGGSSGTAGAGGAAGATGGRGGAGGATSCAGRAVSLSTNGTASAADTAYAHVEMDLGADLPIANTHRTVEFWAFIKTTDWVGEKNEVYYYGGSANATAFGLDFGTNPVTGMPNNHATLNPVTGGGFNDDSTNDLGINSSTDQWVHIAMVWNGTNVITYVNGLPKITTAGTGGTTALATTQSLVILGCNPTNNNCFNGLFDEFRIWNVARTATQIHDNYNKQVSNSDTGLVGYWKFDEASGTTTADAVTGGGHTAHNGTLKANTTALPTFVTPPTPLPLVCN